MPPRRSDDRFPGFTERLKRAMRAAGYVRSDRLDVQRLAHDLSTSTANVYRWLNGQFPREWLPKLCERIAVTQEHLLFGNGHSPPPPAVRRSSSAKLDALDVSAPFNPLAIERLCTLARRWAEAVGNEYEWYDLYRAAVSGFYNGLARTKHYSDSDHLSNLDTLDQWRTGEIPWHPLQRHVGHVRRSKRPVADGEWDGRERRDESVDAIIQHAARRVLAQPPAEQARLTAAFTDAVVRRPKHARRTTSTSTR